MKPHPCLEATKSFEEAAEKAERRKVEAIDRLNAKLGPDGLVRAGDARSDRRRQTSNTGEGTMKVSDVGLATIEAREGKVYTAYADPAGAEVPTSRRRTHRP